MKKVWMVLALVVALVARPIQAAEDEVFGVSIEIPALQQTGATYLAGVALYEGVEGFERWSQIPNHRRLDGDMRIVFVELQSKQGEATASMTWRNPMSVGIDWADLEKRVIDYVLLLLEAADIPVEDDHRPPPVTVQKKSHGVVKVTLDTQAVAALKRELASVPGGQVVGEALDVLDELGGKRGVKIYGHPIVPLTLFPVPNAKPGEIAKNVVRVPKRVVGKTVEEIKRAPGNIKRAPKRIGKEVKRFFKKVF